MQTQSLGRSLPFLAVTAWLGQGTQVLLDVALVALEYVLTGQLMQYGSLSVEYCPGPHGLQ